MGRRFLPLVAVLACTSTTSTVAKEEPPPKAEPVVVAQPVDAPPQPAFVPPLDAAELAAWRDFAKQEWWREGTEIPCDGVVEERPLMGGVTGMLGMGLVCKGANGEQTVWWKRGDAACPKGSALQGVPPPSLDMLVCMRGEIGHGRYTLWRPDGSIERTGEVVEGVPSGLEVSTFANGALESVSTFANGKRVGRHVTFFPDGTRALQLEYEGGEIVGLGTGWWANGRISHQMNFVDGKIDGKYITWDYDGKVCGTSTLVAGTGTMTKYWGDCRVFRTGEMRDGEEVGVWKEFDREGRPVATVR